MAKLWASVGLFAGMALTLAIVASIGLAQATAVLMPVAGMLVVGGVGGAVALWWSRSRP